MKNILISQSIQYIQERNEIRDFLDNKIFDFLNKCNLNGIPVPNNIYNLKKNLNSLKISGIILSGGNDIFFKPKSKNDNLNKKLKFITLKRNLIEKKLINYAIKKKIPILGICRGFQYLNICLKGKISLIKNHVKVKHKINISPNVVYGKKWKNFIDFKVNSFHNYGIQLNELSKKLNCIVKHKNSVEAAINSNFKLLGIMWHPEREKKFSKKNIILFKKFFNA